MLPTKDVRDELNPDLQRYLLWWKRAACLAQLTLVLAAGLSIQFHSAALLWDEAPLTIALNIGVFYAAAASVRIVLWFRKGFRCRQAGLIAEVFLCLACVWNALASGNAHLAVRLCAGGFASGLAVLALLHEWREIKLRYGPTSRCPVAVCIGLALGITLVLTGGSLRLMPDAPLAAYAYTCCAVFAVGIRLKFQAQP